MSQTVWIENVATGRWSAADEDTVEICKETFKGTMQTEYEVGGVVQRNRPTPIPHDPALEERGADYDYTCSGDQATVTLKWGGGAIVSWRIQRVSATEVSSVSH